MEQKFKVLIITYYWPPSGGAGVQRWVKLTKYLSKLGCQCFVLTVDPKVASYSQIDRSLVDDIHSDVLVHKTKSFEIINYYSRIFGKKAVPTAGFTNVDNKSKKQKFVNAIRSNFFIPDPRVGWNSYALKEAVSIIKRENISTVITTSPPHSTQLIGKRLKKKLGVKWIADLRDPWTDIYYYSVLQHSKRSHTINLRKEREVLEQADKIVTVSEGLKELFLAKGKIDNEKISIIPNGYDPEDFADMKSKKNGEHYNVVYTGTMSDIYNPGVFIEALDLVSKDVERKIKLTIVGQVSDQIRAEIKHASFDSRFVPTVPHSEVNQYQMDADLLLLVIPETSNARGILTGKLFEYLATKNPILSIGEKNGDAAKILEKTGAGKAFDRNEINEIIVYLSELIGDRANRIIDEVEIQKFSRVHQAEQVLELINNFQLN